MSGFIDDFNTDTKSAFYGLMDNAVWTKAAGGNTDIYVDFKNEPLLDDLGNRININNPVAQCFSADVPGIVPNDQLAVQDAQYLITDVLDDGDGMLDLMLRKL